MAELKYEIVDEIGVLGERAEPDFLERGRPQIRHSRVEPRRKSHGQGRYPDQRGSQGFKTHFIHHQLRGLIL